MIAFLALASSAALVGLGLAADTHPWALWVLTAWAALALACIAAAWVWARGYRAGYADGKHAAIRGWCAEQAADEVVAEAEQIVRIAARGIE